LGFGVWAGGFGAGPQPPNPQSPIPNPQSPDDYLKILILILINDYIYKLINYIR